MELISIREAGSVMMSTASVQLDGTGCSLRKTGACHRIEARSSLQLHLVARSSLQSLAPRSSASAKCDMEMSMAAFWSKNYSMDWRLDQNRWSSAAAVQHICLHCTPAVQCSLDIHSTVGEWWALTTEEGDFIGCIAYQEINYATDLCKFFTVSQECGESMCIYLV